MTTETDRQEALTEAEMKALEERYDPEVRFRPLLPAFGWAVATTLFILSCYHFYTAGYGIPPATLHRGLHLAFTLGADLLLLRRLGRGEARRGTVSLTPLGLPLWDWVLAIARRRLGALRAVDLR